MSHSIKQTTRTVSIHCSETLQALHKQYTNFLTLSTSSKNIPRTHCFHSKFCTFKNWTTNIVHMHNYITCTVTLATVLLLTQQNKRLNPLCIQRLTDHCHYQACMWLNFQTTTLHHNQLLLNPQAKLHKQHTHIKLQTALWLLNLTKHTSNHFHLMSLYTQTHAH